MQRQKIKTEQHGLFERKLFFLFFLSVSSFFPPFSLNILQLDIQMNIFFLDILLDILLLDTVLRDFLLYLLLNILGLNIEYFASGYLIPYNFLAVPLKSEIE